MAHMLDPSTMIGAPVNGTAGDRLGTVESIYFDNDTDEPERAAVRSDMLGGHVSLVPLKDGGRDGYASTSSPRTSPLVPVSHEEVILEREPITDASSDYAMAGGHLSEEPHETRARPARRQDTAGRRQGRRDRP